MGTTVTLIRTERRTLTINVNRDCTLTVRAPHNMSIEIINKYLKDKDDWIQSKLSFYKNVQIENEKKFTFNEIAIFDKLYKIEYADIKKVELASSTLILPKIAFENAEERNKLINKFVIKIARAELPIMVSDIGSAIGLCPSSIKITQSKNKWGSCDSYKAIKLNPKLIHLPIDLVKYVIIHELIHILELNHSDKFWRKVIVIYPNYKQARLQLKKYSFLLELY